MEDVYTYAEIFAEWLLAANANAAISIYHFFKVNLFALCLIYCMYYIYSKRREELRGSVIRLTKRIASAEKRNIKERKLTQVEESEFNKVHNVVLTKYGLMFGLTVIATMLTSTAALYAALFIWGAGAVAVYFLKGDTTELTSSLEYHALLYPVAIIVVSFFIYISDAPTAEWGRSIGRAIHGGIPPVVSGYLSMMLGIVMFGFPLSFANSIRQKWDLLCQNEDASVLMRRQLRTTNQSDFMREDEPVETEAAKTERRGRRKF